MITTIVFSIVIFSFIITGIILLVFCNKKENFKREPLNDDMYITFSLTANDVKKLGGIPSNKYSGCAGFIHCRMCLTNLIKLARLVDRKVILPPPWLYLHTNHNKGRKLPKDVKWSRYFDFSEYINNNEMAPETGKYLIHEYEPRRGYIEDVKYIEPNTSVDDIKKIDDQVIVLHFYSGWGGEKKNGSWKCGGKEIGGGIGIAWHRKDKVIKFPPSKLVKDYATDIINQYLDDNFIIIHARRGDILTKNLDHCKNNKAFDYWGFNCEEISNATSPDNIKKVLSEISNDKNISIFLMSNEDDSKYFDELKKTYKNLVTEYDIKQFQDIEKELKDQFLIYEISREIGERANKRIATHPCYFEDNGQKCEYKLTDYIKRTKKKDDGK